MAFIMHDFQVFACSYMFNNIIVCMCANSYTSCMYSGFGEGTEIWQISVVLGAT